MKNWNGADPRVRESLKFAVGLSAVVALSGGVLLFLQSKALEAEARAFVEQSVGESSRWVAEAVQNEVAEWVRTVRALDESQLQTVEGAEVVLSEPVVAAGQGNGEGEWISIQAAPEWVAVSRWRFDQGRGDFRRIKGGVNSQRAERPSGLADRLGVLPLNLLQSAQRALEGEVSVVGDWSLDPKGSLVLVVAAEVPSVEREVLLAHLSPTVIQKWFRSEQLVQVTLVDRNGRTLIDPSVTGPMNGPAAQRNPLVGVASEPQNLKVSQFQQRYVDLGGHEFFGGFFRVPDSQLVVLASIPVEEAFAGVHASLRRSMGVWIVLVLACFGLGALAELGVLFRFAGGSRRRKARERDLPSAQGSSQLPSHPHPHPKDDVPPPLPISGPVTLLSVSLEEVEDLTERESVEDLVGLVNDFFVIGRSVAKEFRARLVPTGGASFALVWDGMPVEVAERLLPVRAGLEFRKTIAALNESRKVDGHQSLRVAQGLHGGSELMANVGEEGARLYQPVGGLYAPAFALRQLALRLEVDFLLSDEAMQGLEENLLSEGIGEHLLTPESGLVTVYGIAGYRDESGSEVRCETPYSGDLALAKKVAASDGESVPGNLWLVSNGSKILGPLAPGEVARALFAQEIDFDSECWRDGTGQSAQIRAAGIFSGSEGGDARLWVYDGKALHGPVSAGFISIALDSGAFSLDDHVCEGSTVSGWRMLKDWRAAPVARAA